jgi:23S rRNA (adenine1618-N6)-methyltransferase
MHPKNKHNNPYDFNSLVTEFPELNKHIITTKFGDLSIDFANPKSVKSLNQAILKFHYKIKYWDFPDKNLCPPIPGRVDYIHHISELINKEKKTLILDIGSGATLIYPLLGIAEYNWSFVVSDVDKESIKNAKNIVQKNKLENKIEIRIQKNKSNILKGIIKPNEVFSVTMCNPPFYKSVNEAKQANLKKMKGLKTHNEQRNFSGTSNELWYKGGEKAFLHNYLYESSLYKNNAIWFTSLVSKKDNVKSILISLKKLGAKNVKTMQMKQGNKISRIVAWSYIKTS